MLCNGREFDVTGIRREKLVTEKPTARFKYRIEQLAIIVSVEMGNLIAVDVSVDGWC